MSGALRYRALTSAGSLAGASLALMHGVTVVSTSSSWRGDLHWGVQQLGSGTYLALPVVVALTCASAVMPGGARTDEHLLPLRPRRAATARFLVDVAPLLVVHLVGLGVVAGITLSHGSPVPGSAFVAAAIQTASLAVAAALGRCIGEVLRHPAAVIAAAGCGLLLLIYGDGLLRVSAGNSPYAGLALDIGPYVVAGVVLCALLALLLLVPRAGATGLAAVGLTMVVALGAGVLLDEPTLHPDGSAPDTCREVEGVDVCVYPGYSFMLEDLVGQSRRVLTALRRSSVDPHLDSISQAIPGVVEEPGHSSVLMDVTSLQNGRLNPTATIASSLHPAWCPRINDPRPLPRSFDRAQVRTYAWLSWKAGMSSERSFTAEAPRFAALPARAQREAVQRFFDDNLSCRGLS